MTRPLVSRGFRSDVVWAYLCYFSSIQKDISSGLSNAASEPFNMVELGGFFGVFFFLFFMKREIDD